MWELGTKARLAPGLGRPQSTPWNPLFQAIFRLQGLAIRPWEGIAASRMRAGDRRQNLTHAPWSQAPQGPREWGDRLQSCIRPWGEHGVLVPALATLVSHRSWAEWPASWT